MKEKFGIGVGIFLGLLAAVLLISWPLSANLGEVITSARADGDLGYTLSAHWWAGEVWSADASFPTNTLVYFPDGQDMSGSIWNFLPLFLSAWPHLFTDPISAYQIGILWLMMLNGLAAGMLGFRLAGKWGAIAGAGVILSFPYPWLEAYEGRLEQAFLAPSLLVFWTAISFKETGGKKARWLGFWMAITALSYWYYAPIIALGLLAFLGPDLKQSAIWKKIGEAVVVFTVMISPFLLLLRPALSAGRYAQATQNAQHIFLQRVGNSLNPWEVLSGSLGPTNLGRCLPIVVVIGLCWVFYKTKTHRIWLAVLGVALLFAMGPALALGDNATTVSGGIIPLPFAVFDAIPGMSRFWWPCRFLALVGVSAVAGIALLAQQLPEKKRPLILCILLVLSLLESRQIIRNAVEHGDPSIPAHHLDPAPKGAFFDPNVPDWMLQKKAKGPLLEFPLHELANASFLYGPFHQQPTAHGDGIRAPHIRPQQFEKRVLHNPILTAWTTGRLPKVDSKAVEAIYAMGFRHVVIHKSEQDPAGSLAYIQRFTAMIGTPSHNGTRLAVFDLSPKQKKPSYTERP